MPDQSVIRGPGCLNADAGLKLLTTGRNDGDVGLTFPGIPPFTMIFQHHIARMTSSKAWGRGGTALITTRGLWAGVHSKHYTLIHPRSHSTERHERIVTKQKKYRQTEINVHKLMLRCIYDCAMCNYIAMCMCNCTKIISNVVVVWIPNQVLYF
jgi:hypothetical protein